MTRVGSQCHSKKKKNIKIAQNNRGKPRKSRMANDGQIKEMSIRDNHWKEAPVEVLLAHVFLPWRNSPSGPRPLHYR
jgi:hypothetical protein